MTCTTIRRSDGVVIIACGPRGQRPPAACSHCSRPHTLLCDFKLPIPGGWRTCSAPICAGCAKSDGKGLDYCRAHAAAATPAKCANCAGHPEAYHDGVRRALPWLTSSHCRAWVPENPGGKCKCPGFEPMAAAR